ncbi:serine/threonine-protein kinase [Cellulomonas sp. PhB150]|uniref:serine/threonine-protein kinase n=1 Tax=Cellulomonas sp. PhB150 TaxID=2485188 RepID=UPI000F49C95E|nr:serine/threonine-protein kinase [Cellulomonas sp. PhB150]ROS30574.1 protein kinase-like protein [Cellulomonas sp. PhB150]
MSEAATDASTAPADGTRVLAGRYRLDAVIGRGGMATVHRAHDLVLHRDVAIKLFPSVAEDEDVLLRHSAEIHVLAALSHPGLVTLYDAGSARDGDGLEEVYLVMELVDGPTLAERLRTGPLTVEETTALGHQVAEALAVVHEQQIVHRDIKPGNILLSTHTTDAPVKVADFGIARLSDATRLTMTGVTLGTVRYLSPEQVTGSALGPSTDIYSLGLVLVECLTGHSVFSGTLAESAAARLTSCPTIPGDLPPELASLLSQMTAREPDERPTAGDVAQVLDRMLRDPGATAAVTEVLSLPRTRVSPAVSDKPAPRRSTRARGVAAAVAGALVVGGSILAVQAASGGGAAPQPGPTYPAVGGNLGSALTALQASVTP